MPSTLLFANSNEGRVYALSTSGSAWREFLYLGLEFKKICVVPHFMWAIGGDRQVYVHVHGLDVPIRIKEEAFENERWLPIEGFSNRLLPTDRYHFSNADGTVDRNIDKVRLPSMAWQWEGEWQLDLTLDGQPLDHDGWTYAVDFPATYHPQKNWKSCVRRRKWVRFRRYCALNSWCAVAPLHKDPTQEPFIDVSIGGANVPGASPGLLLVWAVTAHGRVMFRSGVSTTAPEGLRWTAVTTPSGCEVSQISVGATGLVWAVLYNGRAIVRAGITRDTLTGSTWLEVKPPGTNLKIAQVAVGTNSVWCVTNDNHVWFRRGVHGEASGVSEDAAIGSGWVEMVGNISHISVAANDQVFAVGSEDRALYFRSGVSASDPTGKKWRLIQLPMQLSRTSSNFSFSSRQSGNSSPTTTKHRSLNSLYKERLQQETGNAGAAGGGGGGGGAAGGIEETSRSAPTANVKNRPELWHKPELSPDALAAQLEAKQQQQQQQHVGSLVESKLTQKVSLESVAGTSVPVSNEVYEISGKQLKNSRAWSPVRSVGSVVGTEAHPETDSSVFEGETSRDSGVFGECEDHGGSQNWTDCEVQWVGCSAGAVTVDPAMLPNWFNDSFSQNASEELNQSWRLRLLDDLKKRIPANEVESGAFAHYEKAIEMSSWVKSGEARCAKSGHPFEDCLIELEWVNNQGTGPDSGTLTVLNSDGITTKMQFSLSEITCIMCCSEPGSPRLAIHAPRLPPGSSPLKLQFSGDTDLEDWISHLTSVCCQINEVQGRPSARSVWITSGMGDVFVFDPINLEAQQWDREAKSYRQRIDLKATETPYLTALHNGMLIGSRLEISGFIYDDADQVRFDLQGHPTVRLRHKLETQRNIPLHINPRFNENLTVFNSMAASAWSEDEIRDRLVTFAPGAEFKLEIYTDTDGFRVKVNGKEHPKFHYRSGLAPDTVCSLYSSGRVKILQIVYDSPKIIIPLRDVYWRQIGGHMKRVVSCKAGVVWGVGYDNTAWVYTGGWGGAFLKGLETSSQGINVMTDTQNYYIYENQRWNPLSGFSSTGLPTDRHMWSDITGKHKRSKEHAKLLSMHWQWISDWMVDFHNPGGVDRDGWQYAVDFPASYHAKKQFTDYVRRRRWYRKCRLTTSGPWQEIGNTKVVDVALQPDSDDADCTLTVWAIAANGDVLYRRGVSQSQPAGTGWEHVPCDQPLTSISIYDNKVWTVGKNGSAFLRCGITVENPLGNKWQMIEPPGGVSFKQISVGTCGIWALDTVGRLSVRKEINGTFPEGSHWQLLPNVLNDPPHYEGNSGFKNVSVGEHVFAVSQSGYVCKRSGITPLNPAGTGWILGIQYKSCVDFVDENGMTPLQHAAYKGNKEAVQLLLDQGADVNSSKHEYNYTALHFGALSGNAEVCLKLLLAGADPKAINSVGRTPAQMGAFVANHEAVGTINNFVPLSEIERYTVGRGEKEPLLPAILLEPFHNFIMQVNIHPVRILLNLQKYGLFASDMKNLRTVLTEMMEREMKRRGEVNEVMAFKYHYLGYIMGEIVKHRDYVKTLRDGQQEPKTDFAELFAKRVLKPNKDGTLEYVEGLVRECVREFPFRDCTIFRQMVAQLTSKENLAPALDIARAAINGQRGFQDTITFCSSCGEEKPDKKCSKCKEVQYCDRQCQRLHWFTHKKVCSRPTAAAGEPQNSAAKNIDSTEISEQLQKLVAG
uniref:Uncharacterized protein n=1 Tax=Anopheles stephensi TaxID=30069 RepID=A0A182YKR0_ANOST